MEEKLRSISKQIHWSLALKAALFAIAWSLLPFWLFFLIALYLYFVPLFRTRKLAVPFFTLLLLCYFQAPSYFFAVVFAVLFYALLLIKDFFVIDRRAAYEFLILLLSFLLIRSYYLKFNQGVGGLALLGGFALGAVLSCILKSLIDASYDEVTRKSPTMRVFSWLSFMLFTQMLIVGLFLPLDFIYQSILVFLTAVLFIDLAPQHFSQGTTRKKTLATAMTVFALFVIILSSARWSL